MDSTILLIVICMLISVSLVLSSPTFPFIFSFLGINKLTNWIYNFFNANCNKNTDCGSGQFCSNNYCTNCKSLGTHCNPNECCSNLVCEIRGTDVPRCNKPAVVDTHCQCYGKKFPYYGDGSAVGPRPKYCWTDPINFGEAPSIGINSMNPC